MDAMASRRRRRPETPPGPVAELLDQLAAAGVPADVLDPLRDAGDAAEIVDRLVASGALPGPEESLASLLEQFTPLTRRGADPLSAELAGYEFLATMRATGVEEDDVPAVLSGMIESAERIGTPQAMAMLRVLGAVGPPAVRPVASATAQRLAAAGLPDPTWADGLGHPDARTAFGYVDMFGTQEALAITYSYGRKQHALAVLIDHGLGGGVKDVFVGDRPRLVRDNYARTARSCDVDLHDYALTDAADILDRALAAPPCPQADDQVEDVGAYLDLIRTRLDVLRPARPPKLRAVRRTRPEVYRLKITLRGSKPPIWRRVEVASTMTLHELHTTIQAAFGWLGGHLWVFGTDEGEYGEVDPELGHADATRRKLSAVASQPGDRLLYTYDFGDDWEHTILVEDVMDAEPGVAYPRCTAGRRAAPPDDCGGIWGYQDLLETLADPDDPEHAEKLEWLGLYSPTDLDPARFDRTEVNAALWPSATVIAPG